jgi:hypothetical protein
VFLIGDHGAHGLVLRDGQCRVVEATLLVGGERRLQGIRSQQAPDLIDARAIERPQLICRRAS